MEATMSKDRLSVSIDEFYLWILGEPTLRHVEKVQSMMNDLAGQVFTGRYLGAWAYDSCPGAVRFVRLSDDGVPQGAILCVNAAESSRGKYSKNLDQAPFPTRLIMIEQTGEAVPY
jgi:hypothetical protein